MLHAWALQDLNMIYFNISKCYPIFFVCVLQSCLCLAECHWGPLYWAVPILSQEAKVISVACLKLTAPLGGHRFQCPENPSTGVVSFPHPHALCVLVPTKRKVRDIPGGWHSKQVQVVLILSKMSSPLTLLTLPLVDTVWDCRQHISPQSCEFKLTSSCSVPLPISAFSLLTAKR